jgi:DNA polymerase
MNRRGAAIKIGMAMSADRQDAYLQALGIERWVLRDESIQEISEPEVSEAETIALPVISAPPTKAAEIVPVSTDWHSLQQQVAACTQCELHRGRTQTVFGVGNRQADWLVIGEAPGADEDAQGEPFVGRAGQLLNAMLLAIGKPRETVYIANILKCRPPNNRDPHPEEIAQCMPYLQQQIKMLSPKIILAVGRIAAQNILNSEETIGRLRGKVYRLPNFDIPVVVTYHPAYLLRSPAEKRKAWDDLQLACKVFQEAGGMS